VRITDVKKLHTGDQVYWNDPDAGSCSRVLTIQAIQVDGNVVAITEPDGSVVECFARELQAGLPAKRPTLWDNNEIQFARLIDEMMAALDGLTVTRMIADMAASMDLTIGEVNKLLDLAVNTWEQAKPAA
jgi:hypothetical protein